MVLHEHGEADPNKKTMDFPANAHNPANVLFFETELKDQGAGGEKVFPNKNPELPTALLLDVDLTTNQGGALSPLQNSKLSRMINESMVVAVPGDMRNGKLVVRPGGSK